MSNLAHGMSAGFVLEEVDAEDSQRPILLDWWYPVEAEHGEAYNYGLGRGEVIEDGPLAPGVYPLVLLSHGAFGAARNYSWLAEHLAKQGLLVAGVSHYGESYVYGADTVDQSAVLRFWERPQDVSRALTFILAHSRFSASVDGARVSFVGHSSGGATALLLAGAQFDGEKLARYCNSNVAKEDHGCDYARNLSKPVQAVSPAADYGDTRIRRFVALDPALGPGFKGLSRMSPEIDFLVVGSVNNDFLPFKFHAEAVSKQLMNTRTLWLDEGEGHFVYLNECGLDMLAQNVPLCRDRAGVSRASVHERLKEAVARFLMQQGSDT